MKNTRSILKSAGQITLINLLIILVIMIVFFVFLPIIINFTNTYATPAIAGNPNVDASTKDLELALIQLFPVLVMIMILISGLNYAIPRRSD